MALGDDAVYDYVQWISADDQQAFTVCEKNHLGDGLLLSGILGESSADNANDPVWNFIGQRITPLVVFDRILHTLDAASMANPVPRLVNRPNVPA
jgi:hypothetical protein